MLAGLSCLAAPIFLVVLSLRRGLLSFRWYAACAVWTGLSIGLFVGIALAGERSAEATSFAEPTRGPTIVVTPSRQPGF